MSGYRRNLMNATACLSKPACSAGLTQSMRSASHRETGHIALRTKPFGKSHGREWLPKPCHDEAIFARRLGDDIGKRGVNRNCEPYAGFLLPHMQGIIA